LVDVGNIPLERYDIIVSGTAGLFNNIFAKEIEKIINKEKKFTLDHIYRQIMNFIEQNLNNKEYLSPYYYKAVEKIKEKYPENIH
jgi:uncharacterized protein YsxB (DUF464 family)